MKLTLPPINIGNMDIKLSLGSLVLNVLYVNFGYFHNAMPEHSHSNGSYEFHYIPSGHGTLVAEGVSYPLLPGTLFMTGPEIVHEQIPNPDDPMAEYCIFFEVLAGSESVPSFHKNFPYMEKALSDLLINTPFWIGKDKENMMNLFEILARELSMNRIGYHHMTTNTLEMIVVSLIRQYTDQNSSLLPVPLKTLDDSRLLMIENCFLYEYSSITLKLLADRLALSTRQVERTVYKQYGMTFSDKKLQARMSAASRLLTTTEISISSVSNQVGFTTLEQFSHAFKKYFGMTASQYKLLHVTNI